jgi:hypothetical protein
MRVNWRESVKMSSIPDSLEITLQQICEFHARLQSQRHEVGIVPRSIHRLYTAAESILFLSDSERSYGFRDAVDTKYLSHSIGAEKVVLQKIRDEIAR